MNITRIFALTLRQYYLIRDNPTRFIQIFVWILLDIVLWGFISKYLHEVSGMSFVPIFLGGVLLWDFLTRVMTGITIAFFEDVWSRNLLNLFASPLSVFEYVASLVVTGVGTSVLGLLAMLLLAGFAFGLQFTIYGLAFVPFLLILFFCGIALGIFGVAIVLRFGPSAEWFTWPIPVVLAPFVGVFYPTDILPHWMQLISSVLPPSYVFAGMRAVVAGSGVDISMLIAGGVLSVLFIVLACLFFLSIYRRAVRSGLLARYSAESVN